MSKSGMSTRVELISEWMTYPFGYMDGSMMDGKNPPVQRAVTIKTQIYDVNTCTMDTVPNWEPKSGETAREAEVCVYL